MREFSPPAWGWSELSNRLAALVKVFPTRVGMVRHWQLPLDRPSRFPHPRGDGPRIVRAEIALTTFSPPAWGWSAYMSLHDRYEEVFPTRVGMVRNPWSRACTTMCFPHPRGDGPDVGVGNDVGSRFSPPAWGWSVAREGAGARVSVFPTRVGMVR